MKYSVSRENYIKAIYHLQQQGQVTTNALAEELQTRPASVTGMLKKLKEQKLLLYTPYKGFRLSSEGRRVAMQIIRRHRLWELFLTDKLGFAWNEVHPIAEELEHISSTQLVDRLDQYLGFPKWDPHGDPIPDGSGQMAAMDQLPLTELPPDEEVVVSSVSGQTAALLEGLAAKGIGLGTLLTVRQRFSFDGSMEVAVGQKVVTLTETMARHIFVKRDAYQTD